MIWLRELKLNHLNIESTLKYLQIAIYSLLSNIFFSWRLSAENTLSKCSPTEIDQSNHPIPDCSFDY